MKNRSFFRLKDGKPLTPDLGFDSQFDAKTGQITLKHKGVTPKHAGDLICRVENSAGTTDAPVKLEVQSKDPDQTDDPHVFVFSRVF